MLKHLCGLIILFNFCSLFSQNVLAQQKNKPAKTNSKKDSKKINEKKTTSSWEDDSNIEVAPNGAQDDVEGNPEITGLMTKTTKGMAVVESEKEGLFIFNAVKGVEYREAQKYIECTTWKQEKTQ